MKKLLFGLFLFTTTYSWADTFTSGSMGLIKPSTNTIDKSRSWGDKINSNFDILDSTTTLVLNSQSSILTALSTTSAEIDRQKIVDSTAGAKDFDLSLATTTLSTRTIVFSDEGGALPGGNVSRVDCIGDSLVCDQSGSTVTITASAGGGSGTTYRPWTVVVGTAGAPGADFTGNTDAVLRSAVQRITNIQDATTGYGSILFLPGTYLFSGATVPTGISVVAFDKSSTVWALSGSSVELVNCYGNIDGITFDMGGSGWVSQGIAIKQNCRITNSRVIGGQVMANAVTNMAPAIFSATRITSNTYVQSEIIGWNPKVGSADPPAMPIKIDGARDTTWVLKMSTALNYHGHTADAVVYIRNSSNTIFQDGEYLDMASNFFSIREGNHDTRFLRNKMNITGPGNGTGFLHFSYDSSNHFSSYTLIKDNYITWPVTNRDVSNTPFLNTTGNGATALVVEGNTIIGGGISGTTPLAIFAMSGAKTVRAIFRDNSLFDTFQSSQVFISDTANTTQYNGLGNTKNGVQMP